MIYFNIVLGLSYDNVNKCKVYSSLIPFILYNIVRGGGINYYYNY